MPDTANTLTALYDDNQACAKLIGLSYVNGDIAGICRRRKGKGFTYVDAAGRTVTDVSIRQRLAELVIPPAWQEVWICPDDKGICWRLALMKKVVSNIFITPNGEPCATS